MEINYIENIDSTHLHVSKRVKEKSINPPFALYADNQYSGVGSRGNEWIGQKGNLYLSLCIDKKQIPHDVPDPSISIYFASIMKETLKKLGSKVWLKWPNDFYINDKKIGGVITAKIGSVYIVSIGINLLSCPDKFDVLDIKITNHELVGRFCDEIKKNYSWKKVFSKFRVEFQNSKNFTFHKGDKVRSLGDALLCDDGSIKIDGKKVYSLR